LLVAAGLFVAVESLMGTEAHLLFSLVGAAGV
jgi:hypothetical protein